MILSSLGHSVELASQGVAIRLFALLGRRHGRRQQQRWLRRRGDDEGWGQCKIVRPAVEREADAVRDHWLRTGNAHGEGGA